MVPQENLVGQLWSPYAILALGLNVALLVGTPAVALYLADAATRRLATAMGLLAIGLRLVGWYSIPGGLGSDDYVTLTLMGYPKAFDFRSLFGENWDNGGNLISNLPWYVAYRISGSLLAIRFMGTLWSGSLAVVVYCFATRLYGRLPALVCSAVATLTVWSLFISRLTFGSEILALHVCMIWVAWTLNRELGERGRIALPLITLLGVLVAMGQHTYLAARVSLAVPVMLIGFWGWTRLHVLWLIFAVALSALYPYILTKPGTLFSSGSQFSTLLDPASFDPVYLLSKIARILRGFVDRSYTVAGTIAMPGAHTVGWFISCVVLANIAFAPRFAVLFLVGLLPALFSNSPTGNSHRMMMMLIPAALAAGAGFSRLPARFRSWACGGAFVGIIVISMMTWLSDDYWTLADRDLIGGITAHRLFHRERKADPNIALLGGDGHRLLYATETGSTIAEIATVDCSRPFTLVMEDEVEPGRRRAAALGGELVAGTRDTIALFRLNPADARHPVLSDLTFCRDPVEPTPDPTIVASGATTAAPAAPKVDRAAVLAFRPSIVLWLEADKIKGMKEGELVRLWPDSSGVKHPALQPERAMRPTYRAKALSGLPVVEFAAQRTNTMIVKALSLPAETTAFFVVRARNPGSHLPFFEHGPNFNTAPGFLLYGTAPMYGVFRDGAADIATGTTNWITGEWGVISATYDRAVRSRRFRIRRNGVPQDVGAETGALRANSAVVETFHIGSRSQSMFWSDMDLAEVILVTRALTEPEVAKVERYLAGKWGLQRHK